MVASALPITRDGASSGRSSPIPSTVIPVVYVIDKMGPGGAQTHLGGLISALDHSRFQPSLVCLVRGGVVASRLQEARVPVKILGLQRAYGLKGAHAFVGLVRWLRRGRPRIVHTYLSTANVYGALAARAAGVPRIVTTRRDTGFGDSRLMRRALRATNRWAARVVAVSQDAARLVREREGLGDGRLEIVPNGIDVSGFTPRGRRDAVRAALGVTEGTQVAVTVTHLSPVKGVDLLVEAAGRVCRALPRTVFLVAGKGTEQDRIARSLRRLGLDGSVRLLGERADVPDLLEAADLFVLPSRSEGQPNAVIEAMAMGLPVVATRVGGVPELVEDGVEGLLVEAGSAVALAEGCLEVLASPDLGTRLGRAAQARARRDFDVGTMARRYQSLYESLLGGPR
jgi:glycosyltransferase involved in cell wall biosynthesis